LDVIVTGGLTPSDYGEDTPSALLTALWLELIALALSWFSVTRAGWDSWVLIITQCQGQTQARAAGVPPATWRICPEVVLAAEHLIAEFTTA
jgi:hypothetical protein